MGCLSTAFKNCELCSLGACVAVFHLVIQGAGLPFPSFLKGSNLWWPKVNYHLLGCLETPLVLKGLSSCWSSGGKRPIQLFLSSVTLCVHIVWRIGTLIMRLMQDSTWREVLAEEAPKPPYLVIIMNVGVHLHWVTVEPGGLQQRSPFPAVVKIRLSIEKEGVTHEKPPFCPGSIHPTWQSAAVRLRGSGLARSNMCSVSPGRMWGRMSDEREDAVHLSGQTEASFSPHVDTHTQKVGPCNVHCAEWSTLSVSFTPDKITWRRILF